MDFRLRRQLLIYKVNIVSFGLLKVFTLQIWLQAFDQMFIQDIDQAYFETTLVSAKCEGFNKNSA